MVVCVRQNCGYNLSCRVENLKTWRQPQRFFLKCHGPCCELAEEIFESIPGRERFEKRRKPGKIFFVLLISDVFSIVPKNEVYFPAEVKKSTEDGAPAIPGSIVFSSLRRIELFDRLK